MSIRKWISIIFSLCLVFTMIGCSHSQENETSTEKDVSIEVTETKNVLVVYFSRTGEQYGVGVIDKGNTAIVAEMIAEEMKADTYEILPEKDNYPTTYDELIEFAKQEQANNVRPKIKGTLPDLSKYDTIFIGAPVWWGDWPMICYTYFESNDFSNKKLIPFNTHAGSGLSGFDSKLKKAAPNSQVLEGLAIKGTEAQNNQKSVKKEVKSWLEKLEL